jgi:hypothetical protein
MPRMQYEVWTERKYLTNVMLVIVVRINLGIL